MSVIIRLQNLPWSANALDIRNFFRGLSIPEGGVHIVGGELGDAFIAFSTDEDARQAMMLNGGKIKEIQVNLLLSSRSEMHKVIETARQAVPLILAPAPAPTPIAPAIIPTPTPIVTTTVTPNIPTATPAATPFATALGNNFANFGIPGIGNPQEIPQPAVIEPPAPMVSPTIITPDDDKEDSKEPERRRSKEKERRRTRSRSRSRDRDRKDRKRDRRDRSRSRERRRRDRSRSRERRDRKRDRKDRSRSRDRSPSRRSRDKRKSPDKPVEIVDTPAPPPPPFGINQNIPQMQMQPTPPMNNQMGMDNNRFIDPDTFNKLNELGKKRNPNAFQGNDQQNGAGGGRFNGGRGGVSNNYGRGGPRNRNSRFENNFDGPPRDCCVAVRNAPNHTSYGDVRRFFPFMIDKHGIKMINDNMGRRTGTIFVRFCDPRSKQLALQRKNNELKGAEVIVEHLDDEAYENAIDSFLPFREDNHDDDVIIAPEEPPQPPFNVLKLTELPHYVKEHDIIKAFSDFSLLSIMLNDCRLTRTKTAFVQFVKPEDARMAFERKDRLTFGRRQPTVVSVTNDEYEQEKIMQNDKLQDARNNAQMPMEPRAEAEPPAAPLMPEPAAPRDPRQRRPHFDNAAQPAGLAPQAPGPGIFTPPFIQQQPFQAPFADPRFGGFPASNLDPRAAAANWANRPAYPNQPIQAPIAAGPPQRNHSASDFDNEPLDCVLMKGLPREATDRTIVTFLSDTGAVPARIHLMLDPNGMPSGDCFCEFRSTQEARMAASKHGHNLDGCRVTIDLVTRGVVDEALEGPKVAEVRNEGLLGPVPYFDSPRGGGGFSPRGGFRGRGGYDRGGSGFERGSSYYRGGYDAAARGGGSFRGRGSFERSSGDRGGGRSFLDRIRRGFSRGRGFENGRDWDQRERDEEPIPSPDPNLEDFGAPGCVVSMENVPFRASVDEILTFFSEFDLTQDDVIRRFNERGQPTGDARVAFRTPFDAQRAVKTRHMDTIHERRITLTIL